MLDRLSPHTTFGIDVVLEPIYSTTWAEAARDTVTASGAMVRKGDHTVDKEFRFANSMMRVGFGYMAPPSDSAMTLGVQFGLGVHTTRYRLGPTDLIRKESRVQRESWMEWTPTLGLRLRKAGFELRYAFSLTCGAGGCDFCLIACGDDVSISAPAPSSGGVIAAPAAAIRFDGGRVTTHRFSVSLKLK